MITKVTLSTRKGSIDDNIAIIIIYEDILDLPLHQTREWQ